MPYHKRQCEVCSNDFTPRPPSQRANRSAHQLSDVRCADCRRLGDAVLIDRGERAQALSEGIQPPPFDPAVELHRLAPPMTQIVFDLETWGLDRGWGVLLMGSFLVWKNGTPEMATVSIRDFAPWHNGIRSDDREITKAILDILSEGHIAYAHNGRNFDMKWLWTLALKHKFAPPNIKLVDPVQIARRRYRIGNNSLGALANFLNLSERKMPLSEDVWRHALLDDDDASWALLRDRCESDVRVLAQVAGHVTRDAGMIDNEGSGWRG